MKITSNLSFFYILSGSGLLCGVSVMSYYVLYYFDSRVGGVSENLKGGGGSIKIEGQLMKHFLNCPTPFV